MRNDLRETGREEERGIALIIVLVVLLLTSILALEIKSSAALHMRMARNQRDDFLVRAKMRGHLEIVKQVLLLDAKENNVEALDDRWTEDRYTSQAPDPDVEPDAEEPISTEQVSLSVKIEDEERKFNLHNLVVENEDLRNHWEEVFVRLLILFREDHGQHSISEAQARNLLERLRDWLDRKDDSGGIPRPNTINEKQVLITPDELLMVKGFTRDILYDLQPEEADEEPIPGLAQYLTLWSSGQVNLNTADPVVLRAIFSETDQDAADSFIEWREEEAEQQPENQPADAEPKKNAIRSPQDLLQIDGFTPEVMQRSRLDANTVTVRGTRFSVHLTGESSDGIRRQERWVIERNQAGFTTILFEERNDPVYGDEEDEG